MTLGGDIVVLGYAPWRPLSAEVVGVISRCGRDSSQSFDRAPAEGCAALAPTGFDGARAEDAR